TPLASVGSKPYTSAKVRGRIRLPNSNLFVRPWYMSSIAADDFTTHADRPRQQVPHHGPTLKRLDRYQGILLRRRPIGQAVQKCLYQRRAHFIHWDRPETIAVLSQRQQAPVGCLCRAPQARKLRTAQKCVYHACEHL